MKDQSLKHNAPRSAHHPERIDAECDSQPLAMALAWDNRTVKRVDYSNEWTRKLWHMAPGLFALIVPLIPHRDPISPTMGNIVLLVTSAGVAIFLMQSRRLSRPGERDFTVPVLGYAIPVAVSILVFPAKMELGLAVLAILAFGDGAAALAGTRLPRHPLSWNREKTMAGFLAFVAAATPAATWAWWAEAHPRISVEVAFTLALAGSFAAAIAESIRSPINDNVRVGITAAATFFIVDRLVVFAH